MRAPSELLVWYLAVFRRMFVAMETAAATRDRELMWLTQWAADSLHNVPEALLQFGEPPSRSGRNSGVVRSYLLTLPTVATQHGAPPRVAMLAASLVVIEESAAELGLTPDLADLDLAPAADLAVHLERLRKICLWTRLRSCWPGPEPDAWRRCEEAGWYNGICGGRAKELPPGLVHWSTFDSVAFRTRLEQPYPEPESFAPSGPSHNSSNR